jgi:5-methylcytosine-specific restriction protein A
MKFRITDEAGLPLDANVLLESSAIVVLSRGGTAGSGNSQNQDYPAALRLILQRLRAYDRAIAGAWVDSGPARALPLSERQIYFPEDATADAKTLFSLFGKRMERIAKAPGSIPNKGNRNKRLRIEVATGSIGELASVIAAKADADVPRSALRLPASDLRKVTETEIWSAIDRLRIGTIEHGFAEPLEYQLVTEDGALLPPDAVFGLAASEALGFPVQPANFTGGVGTVCFEMLEGAGWSIVRKGTNGTGIANIPETDEREWVEGDERRLAHLRRERHPGVARAKKAQMRRLHGKLFCEDCGLDPVAQFGEDGEACIEVHHSATEVAQMVPGHVTKLADVECLCANCHRVRHRRMKSGQPAKIAGAVAAS